jgi:hypothetical protein
MKKPSLVHASVWDGGALYIDGQLVSNYYTSGQADIVEALGFNPIGLKLNHKWYKDHDFPKKLKDCVLDKGEKLPII